MATSKWKQTDKPLIVTRQGIFAICPACAARILLVSDDSVDPCPVCGQLLRITIESHPPYKRRGRPRADNGGTNQ